MLGDKDRPTEWTAQRIVHDNDDAYQGGVAAPFTACAYRLSKQVLSLEAQLLQAKEMCLALASVVERRNEAVDQLRLDGHSDTNLVNFIQFCIDNDKDAKCREFLTEMRVRLLNSAVNTNLNFRASVDLERNIFNGAVKVKRDVKGRRVR